MLRAERGSTRHSSHHSEHIVEDRSLGIDGEVQIRRYTRGKFLGKGGFARCYELRDVETGQIHAGKIVPKNTLHKTKAKQKLLAEIKIHRSLRHRHVVRFEHFFEDKDNVYIVLELCPNQTLMELVKRRHRLTEPEARYLLLQVLEGVKHMHHQKIIHRDLKLGNLFLSDKMEVKIGDFGLATKLDHANERKRTMCGTPNYIAPEILVPNQYDGHSFEVDTWSIGVILYAMIIGKPPFETNDVKSTYKKIRSNMYSFPEHVHISHEAKQLIKEILHPDPRMRPSIDRVINSPFMRALPTPRSLPVSALTTTPRIPMTAREPGYEDGYRRREPENAQTALATQREPARQPLRSIGNQQNHINTHATKLEAAKERERERERERAIKAEAAKEAAYRPASAPQGKKEQVYRPSTAPYAVNEAPKPDARAGYATERTSKEVASTALPKGYATERASTAGSDALLTARGVSSITTATTAAASSKFTTSKQAFVEQSSAAQPQAASIPREEARGSPDVDSELASGLAKASLKEDGATKKSVGAGLDTSDDGDLTSMHAQLTQSFAHHGPPSPVKDDPLEGAAEPAASVDPGASSGAAGVGPPAVCVAKWVDYSNKYGLGYQLSDGSVGVYFNDASKIVMSPNGHNVEYIERKRNSPNGANQREERIYTDLVNWQNDHPSMQKKMTLLKHFRNYLVQKDGRPITLNGTPPPKNYTYVKRWLRTRHAIIFRLSNKTVQVNFVDHTEIILSSEARVVTYVNKRKERTTHSLATVLNKPCPDLVKRLRYTKDVLYHMLKSSKK